jgi:hypothetical protein
MGNSAGTATITATVTDGTNYSYAMKTATYTLTVKAADPILVNSTFQYWYDVQRSPAYPVSGSSCRFSGFSNPNVGNHTTTGPWKLEYKGSYSSDNNEYNISVGYYQSKYNIQSVPIFELLQWNAAQNDFVHAAYGVVCAYSNVTGNVDHTAFFEADNSLGCYLTGQSHSSSLDLTFDEYMSDGLHSLIPNNTLSYITVSKGSTGLSGDKRFYYTPGETYRQAIANHAENTTANVFGDIGWGIWESSGLATIWYKENNQNSSNDMRIDGDNNFESGKGTCTLTLDSVVDPNHTYDFQ